MSLVTFLLIINISDYVTTKKLPLVPTLSLICCAAINNVAGNIIVKNITGQVTGNDNCTEILDASGIKTNHKFMESHCKYSNEV